MTLSEGIVAARRAGAPDRLITDPVPPTRHRLLRKRVRRSLTCLGRPDAPQSIKTGRQKAHRETHCEEDGMGAAKGPIGDRFCSGARRWRWRRARSRANCPPAQDRHPERHVERLRRLPGRGLGRRRSARRGRLLEDARRAGRNRLRRPSEQGRRRRGDRAPMVRLRKCRRHHGPAEFRGCARGDRGRPGEKQGGHRLGRRVLGDDRSEMLAQFRPLDL